MPTPDGKPTNLDRLGEQAAARPGFLGNALDEYARRCGFNDFQLCQRLGCGVEMLAHLRLCRRPDTREEVRQIAHRYGCYPAVLASACCL